LCGGIYVNYQEYIKDEEQNWIPLISIILFSVMLLLNIYQLIHTLKNIKYGDKNA
jgi:hypothetical protein